MGRENQKQRTRTALIDAAGQIARDGRSFSVAEVAEAAMVSTATAYRYFPNPESLWVEVAIRQSEYLDVPAILRDAGDSAADRIDALIAAGADMQFGNEALWRALLRATLERWAVQHQADASDPVPIRGDNRLAITEQALQPLAATLPPALLRRLTMALMLVYGIEATVTIRDACQLEPDEGKKVMRWAAQALIRTALAETAAESQK